jgi:hypothetical protein
MAVPSYKQKCSMDQKIAVNKNPLEDQRKIKEQHKIRIFQTKLTFFEIVLLQGF